jgi:peptidoglycan hydrolase-like protein with peptidoglycan-binding domain
MLDNSIEFSTLKIGSSGKDVRKWQKFLSQDQEIKLDPESMALDGIYGVGTAHGTITYQASKSLTASGIVDSITLAQALEDGFDARIDV